ncbi:phage tail tape measure protein [Salinibacter altiplanensis]|uniref:phage tail tape measure protein n=1 Tax=Salinibacter altiplanensis TaxID=1803181 RepID=UPI000C9EDF83|nr:phage tail tape measure protein [Salinibacter altiplanensis]
MPEPLKQKLKVEPEGVKKTFSKVRAGLAGVDASTKKTSGLFGGLISKVKSFGGAAKVAIAGTAVGAFVALIGTLTKATQEASAFEKKLAEVGTLLDGDVSGKLERFEKGLNEIRRDLPQARSLVGALYDAISAGVDPDNALSFVRTAAESAIAGVTDTKTAVNGLTTVLNAFNKDISEADQVADSFFTAVEQGKTTFPELADSIGLVAPLAQSLGVSLDEVNATLATLTANGRTTSQATRELRQILNALTKNAEDFRRIGINVNEVLDERGLQGVLQEVQKATGGANAEIQSLFGRVQAVNGVLTLASGSAGEFAGNLGAMEGKAGATSDALGTMEEATASLFQQLKNNLTVVLRGLGSQILPALNSVLETTIGFAEDLGRSDAERFLSTLRDAEGIDPGVMRQLEATIDTRKAEDRLDELRSKVEEETVAVGVDLSGEEAELIREDLQGLTTRELHSSLQDVNDALESRAERVAELEAQEEDLSSTQERVLFIARARRKALEEAQSEMLDGIKTISQLEAAQERAAEARGRLDEALSGDGASTSGGEGGSEPAFSAEERASARESLAKLSKEIREQERLRAAETAEAESILEGIISTEEQIKKVQAAQRKLRGENKEEAQELLKILREQLDEQSSALDDAERASIPLPAGGDLEDSATRMIDSTAEALKEAEDAFPSFPELLGLDNPADVISEFRSRISQLRLKELTEESFSEADFAEAASKEAERFKQRIIEIKGELEEMGFEVGKGAAEEVVGGLQEMGDTGEETDDNLQNVADTLNQIAAMAEGLSRIGEELGIIGEEAASAIQGISQLAQGASSAVAGFSSGNIAQGISGSIQAIGGAIQAGSSIFGDNGPDIEKLQSKIEQNTREIVKNTKGLLEEGQIGGDVSEEDIDRAEGLVEEILTGPFNEGEIIDQFEQIGNIEGLPDFSGQLDPLEEFIESEFGADNANELAAKLLTGEMSFEEFGEATGTGGLGEAVIQDFLGEDFQPLGDVLTELDENLGMFSDSLSGAIGELELMRDFGGTSTEKNFDSFIQGLLDLDSVSSDLKEELESAADVDVTTEEGRQRLQEIIAAIAASLKSGDLDTGDLSPNEIEELLDSLQSFAEEGGTGESPEERRRRQTQIQRTITEIQANELIALETEQLFTLRGILQALGGDVETTSFEPMGVGGPVALEVDDAIREIRDSVVQAAQGPASGDGGSGGDGSPGAPAPPPGTPPGTPPPRRDPPERETPVRQTTMNFTVKASDPPRVIAEKMEEAARLSRLSQ